MSSPTIIAHPWSLTEKLTTLWNNIYSKANLFDDSKASRSIMKVESCNDQLKLGKRVRGFDRQRWGAATPAMAKKGLLAKFSSKPTLTKTLKDTENRILIEASPYDKFWGAGLPMDHSEIGSASSWLGINILGNLLQEVRSERC